MYTEKQDIKLLYRKIQGHRVTIDTRTIKKGDIFIGIKGENFDGNAYAQEALDKGAIVAIIDNPKYKGENCIEVENSLKCLQQLAAYHRKILNIPILGITGTNGKTTTKELCKAVLSTKFTTFATEGNYNNHIGVPLTLLSMTKDTEFGIVEMGANHLGEIKELCDIADPDYAIITNIGYAHLEGFGCYENIIATKNALYEHIIKKKGIIFVNKDNELLLNLSKEAKTYSYGTDGEFLKGEIKQNIPFLVYSIITPKGQLYIKTELVGEYNFENAMAASCLGLYFDIDPLKIQDAIESYKPSNLRSQLLKSEYNTIIIDAYNANPSSMDKALENFDAIEHPNKVLILGQMGELGKDTIRSHQEIVHKLIDIKSNTVILIGENYSSLELPSHFIYLQNTDCLLEYLELNKIKDAMILVKGSRSNNLEKCIKQL